MGAMVDAARLADELIAEQDHATNLAGAKNSLNNQLGELEGRLADAENAALKGGKAAMAKLEGKIKDLEAELAQLSLALERPQRPSREPNARPRSSPLLREKIERTKTVCLSWHQSSKERSRPTNSRSKKLKRLPLSILPSSARLSKNLRKPRNGQSLLWSCKSQSESSRASQKDVTHFFSLVTMIEKHLISR